MPASLSEYIMGAYVSMRCDEEESATRDYFFTTARTLISIIRISQVSSRQLCAKSTLQCGMYCKGVQALTH